MSLHDFPSNSPAFRPSNKPWTVRRNDLPRPAPTLMPPLTQRYQVEWLDASGQENDFIRMGPAVALFTQAFTALVRGAILTTTTGPMAVEDLYPGVEVLTETGPRKLLWKGSHTVLPGAKGKPLYRLPADSMGLGRPMPDLVLGPAARIVSRRSILQTLIGKDAALVPIGALADGQSVVRITPLSAVQCFHLGFDCHTTFLANGVEVESVHPGVLDPALGEELQRFYMSMFPHLSEPQDFGNLSLPRLRDDQVHELSLT